MAFTENSKLYAVKVVDGQKLLFEASKDEVRKAPRVDTLPSPSGNKRGLIYLYDDGNGEKGYICVKTGDDCEWLPLGVDSETVMSKATYDDDRSVEKAGGIKDYVYNQIEDLSGYIEGQLSQKQNILFFDSTPTYSSFNPVTSDGIKAAIDASANVQSDWSTYNSASKSYVKNRPIYDDRRAGDTICSGTVTTSTSYTLTTPDGYSYNSTADRNYAAHRRLYEYLNPGRTYSVNLKGVDYGFHTAKIGTITHNGGVHYSAVYIDIIGFALLAQWIEVVGDYQEFVLFIGTYSTGSTAFTLRSIEGSLGPLDKKYAPWAEQIDSRVSSISQGSDDNHYPTAKAVYDSVSGKENTSNKTTSITSTSTDTQYPTAKAVWDYMSSHSGSSVSLGSITLGTTWSGAGPYTQTVTITGVTVTSNTKVDLQPDTTALAQMASDGITALYIENNAGTLTAYALDGKPTTNLQIQCTLTDIIVSQ